MSREPRNFKTYERIEELEKILDLLQRYDCRPAFESEEEEMELRKAVLLLIAISPWEEREMNRYNFVIGRANILIQEKNLRLRKNLNCKMEKKGCSIS